MAQHKATKRAPRGPDGNPKRDVVFTLDHATRALPYIQRIVADVVSAHETAVSEQGALQGTSPGAERSRHQTAFARAVERLNELGEELRAAGVDIKDQATGVIEFPATHRREPAVLVWSLGEDKITHARVVSSGTAVAVDQLD